MKLVSKSVYQYLWYFYLIGRCWINIQLYDISLIYFIQLTYSKLQYFFIITLTIKLFLKPDFSKIAFTIKLLTKSNSSIIALTTKLSPNFSPAMQIVTTLKLLQKPKTSQKFIIGNLTNLPNQGNFALNSNSKNVNIITLMLLLIIW